MVAGSPMVLIANPSLKVRSVPELIALAKSKPRQINYASSGSGSITHLGAVRLERMGGILVYDITDPEAPVFMDYLNSREDWTTEDPSTVLAEAGDLGPEGLVFVSATDSPNGTPLLIVGNEVSGTTAVYEIEEHFAAE